ncbi:MAG: hypothetical protein H0T73_20065 [Ardenticatenales bacterium]|nr:hypothetical protein [Ardenticatenales bacterium]
MGLSPTLNMRLREVLLRCGPMGHSELRALFVDERISAWQHVSDPRLEAVGLSASPC